jgi:hypothetical protein
MFSKINFKIFNTKNKNQMKHTKLSEILGRDVDVNETLTAEDLTRIENGLVTEQTTSTVEEKPVVAESNAVEASQIDVVAAINSAVASSIAPLASQLQSIQNRLDVVEGNPGATVVTTPKVAGATENVLEPWEDPNSLLNQQINASIK